MTVANQPIAGPIDFVYPESDSRHQNYIGGVRDFQVQITGTRNSKLAGLNTLIEALNVLDGVQDFDRHGNYDPDGNWNFMAGLQKNGEDVATEAYVTNALDNIPDDFDITADYSPSGNWDFLGAITAHGTPIATETYVTNAISVIFDTNRTISANYNFTGSLQRNGLDVATQNYVGNAISALGNRLGGGQSTSTFFNVFQSELGISANRSGALISVVTTGGTVISSIRYNRTAGKWQFSNDGTTYSDFGSGTGGTGGIFSLTDALINASDVLDTYHFYLTEVDGTAHRISVEQLKMLLTSNVDVGALEGKVNVLEQEVTSDGADFFRHLSEVTNSTNSLNNEHIVPESAYSVDDFTVPFANEIALTNVTSTTMLRLVPFSGSNGYDGDGNATDSFNVTMSGSSTNFNVMMRMEMDLKQFNNVGDLHDLVRGSRAGSGTEDANGMQRESDNTISFYFFQKVVGNTRVRFNTVKVIDADGNESVPSDIGEQHGFRQGSKLLILNVFFADPLASPANTARLRQIMIVKEYDDNGNRLQTRIMNNLDRIGQTFTPELVSALSPNGWQVTVGDASRNNQFPVRNFELWRMDSSFEAPVEESAYMALADRLTENNFSDRYRLLGYYNVNTSEHFNLSSDFHAPNLDSDHARIELMEPKVGLLEQELTPNLQQLGRDIGFTTNNKQSFNKDGIVEESAFSLRNISATNSENTNEIDSGTYTTTIDNFGTGTATPNGKIRLSFEIAQSGQSATDLLANWRREISWSQDLDAFETLGDRIGTFALQRRTSSTWHQLIGWQKTSSGDGVNMYLRNRQGNYIKPTWDTIPVTNPTQSDAQFHLGESVDILMAVDKRSPSISNINLNDNTTEFYLEMVVKVYRYVNGVRTFNRALHLQTNVDTALNDIINDYVGAFKWNRFKWYGGNIAQTTRIPIWNLQTMAWEADHPFNEEIHFPDDAASRLIPSNLSDTVKLFGFVHSTPTDELIIHPDTRTGNLTVDGKFTYTGTIDRLNETNHAVADADISMNVGTTVYRRGRLINTNPNGQDPTLDFGVDGTLGYTGLTGSRKKVLLEGDVKGFIPTEVDTIVGGSTLAMATGHFNKKLEITGSNDTEYDVDNALGEGGDTLAVWNNKGGGYVIVLDIPDLTVNPIVRNGKIGLLTKNSGDDTGWQLVDLLDSDVGTSNGGLTYDSDLLTTIPNNTVQRPARTWISKIVPVKAGTLGAFTVNLRGSPATSAIGVRTDDRFGIHNVGDDELLIRCAFSSGANRNIELKADSKSEFVYNGANWVILEESDDEGHPIWQNYLSYEQNAIVGYETSGFFDLYKAKRLITYTQGRANTAPPDAPDDWQLLATTDLSKMRGTITHAQLGADVIENDNIADNAVELENIKDKNVSAEKLTDRLSEKLNALGEISSANELLLHVDMRANFSQQVFEYDVPFPDLSDDLDQFVNIEVTPRDPANRDIYTINKTISARYLQGMADTTTAANATSWADNNFRSITEPSTQLIEFGKKGNKTLIRPGNNPNIDDAIFKIYRTNIRTQKVVMEATLGTGRGVEVTDVDWYDFTRDPNRIFQFEVIPVADADKPAYQINKTVAGNYFDGLEATTASDGDASVADNNYRIMQDPGAISYNSRLQIAHKNGKLVIGREGGQVGDELDGASFKVYVTNLATRPVPTWDITLPSDHTIIKTDQRFEDLIDGAIYNVEVSASADGRAHDQNISKTITNRFFDGLTTTNAETGDTSFGGFTPTGSDSREIDGPGHNGPEFGKSPEGFVVAQASPNTQGARLRFYETEIFSGHSPTDAKDIVSGVFDAARLVAGEDKDRAGKNLVFNEKGDGFEAEDKTAGGTPSASVAKTLYRGAVNITSVNISQALPQFNGKDVVIDEDNSNDEDTLVFTARGAGSVNPKEETISISMGAWKAGTKAVVGGNDSASAIVTFSFVNTDFGNLDIMIGSQTSGIPWIQANHATQGDLEFLEVRLLKTADATKVTEVASIQNVGSPNAHFGTANAFSTTSRGISPNATDYNSSTGKIEKDEASGAVAIAFTGPASLPDGMSYNATTGLVTVVAGANDRTFLVCASCKVEHDMVGAGGFGNQRLQSLLAIKDGNDYRHASNWSYARWTADDGHGQNFQTSGLPSGFIESATGVDNSP